MSMDGYPGMMLGFSDSRALADNDLYGSDYMALGTYLH